MCGLRPRKLVFDALIVTTKASAPHKWLFPTRIRPNSFTWKSSSTAAARIKEAIAEIKTVSRNDPATEQETVRAELGKIAALRLAKAFGSGDQ